MERMEIVDYPNENPTVYNKDFFDKFQSNIETAISDSKKTIIVEEAGTDLDNYMEDGMYFFDSSVKPTNIPARQQWLA